MTRERVRYCNTGPFPYYIGFTTCADAFAREMKRLKIKDDIPAINSGANATTHHLTNPSKPGTSIIVMQKPHRRVSKEQYAALLAHEATHVIQEMKLRLGDLGSEAEAYLVQQIVQDGLQIAWNTGHVRRLTPKP